MDFQRIDAGKWFGGYANLRKIEGQLFFVAYGSEFELADRAGFWLEIVPRSQEHRLVQMARFPESIQVAHFDDAPGLRYGLTWRYRNVARFYSGFSVQKFQTHATFASTSCSDDQRSRHAELKLKLVTAAIGPSG